MIRSLLPFRPGVRSGLRPLLRLLPLLLLVALLGGPRPAFGVDLGDGLVRLRAATWDARTGPGPATTDLQRTVALAPGERGAWVVTFEGPADRAIRAAIEAGGARIAGYIPSGAYLVRATDEQADALGSADGVLRVERFRPEWKVSPEVGARPGARADRLALVVLLYDDVSPADVADAVRALGAEPFGRLDGAGVPRLRVRARPEQLGDLARLPGVAWIEDQPRPSPRNDVVRWVIQSDVTDFTPLHDRGLRGEGQILGHIDEPIYLDSCFFLDPTGAEIGPDHRKLVGWRRITGPTAGSHGTHTAGTLAGDQEPVNGFTENAGMAPLARLSAASYYDLDGEYNAEPSNLLDFLLAAHADGARVHSNSWGDDDRTGYTSWCLDADTFLRDHEDDLVVFATTNLVGLRSPENAKSVLSVGASRRPPLEADHRIGGAGPTADGRRKPDVCAPGEATRSATTVPCGTTTSTGTSMACPAVAGGAALVREYFVRGFYPTGAPQATDALVPSGALLKAAVINSAVDMTGVPGYPSDLEGWGRILLDDALHFAGEARDLWVRDVRNADGLETGGTRTWSLVVDGGAEPLDVTLAWTDRPGTMSASLWTINDLDLEVEAPDGTLYLGNVFDVVFGVSSPGGSADPRNTVERVRVSVPAAGLWTVRVRGTSIPDGPQGFAVVANADFRRMLLADQAPAPGPPGDLDPRAGGLPDVLTLGPYSPNPFPGGATLRWALPVEAPVSLRIYDTSGRLVRVLLDRVVRAGDHRAQWDGRDERGRPVVPGIYLARLESGGEIRTVKGVLLR